MNSVTIKKIGECDYYTGPNAIPGIKFRSAGRQLGVTAWGMNVLEIAAGCTEYPEHDHVSDGQEEVYVVLNGSATLKTSDGQFEIETGMMIRVAPGTTRKFLPGKDGLTILAIGATPGQAYPHRH
jgi:mannose-6-phosphate isomerase-like protein (cupin superfamily)